MQLEPIQRRGSARVVAPEPEELFTPALVESGKVRHLCHDLAARALVEMSEDDTLPVLAPDGLHLPGLETFENAGEVTEPTDEEDPLVLSGEPLEGRPALIASDGLFGFGAQLYEGSWTKRSG